MYNKNQYRKFNDKKILHKVKKQWVTISLALLMIIGGGAVATHVSANADTTADAKPQVTSNAPQSNSASSITNQAKALHNDMVRNAGLSQAKPAALGVTDNSSNAPKVVKTAKWDNANVNYYNNDVMELTGNGTISAKDVPTNLPKDSYGNVYSNWTLKIDKSNANINLDNSAKGGEFSANFHPIWNYFKSMDLSGLHTNNVTNMNSMFEGDEYLQEADLSGFNTSNVTNMDYMFSGDTELSSLNLSNFDTHKASMTKFFNQDNNLMALTLGDSTKLNSAFKFLPMNSIYNNDNSDIGDFYSSDDAGTIQASQFLNYYPINKDSTLLVNDTYGTFTGILMNANGDDVTSKLQNNSLPAGKYYIAKPVSFNFVTQLPQYNSKYSDTIHEGVFYPLTNTYSHENYSINPSSINFNSQITNMLANDKTYYHDYTLASSDYQGATADPSRLESDSFPAIDIKINLNVPKYLNDANNNVKSYLNRDTMYQNELHEFAPYESPEDNNNNEQSYNSDVKQLNSDYTTTDHNLTEPSDANTVMSTSSADNWANSTENDMASNLASIATNANSNKAQNTQNINISKNEINNDSMGMESIFNYLNPNMDKLNASAKATLLSAKNVADDASNAVRTSNWVPTYSNTNTLDKIADHTESAFGSIVNINQSFRNSQTNSSKASSAVSPNSKASSSASQSVKPSSKTSTSSSEASSVIQSSTSSTNFSKHSMVGNHIALDKSNISNVASLASDLYYDPTYQFIKSNQSAFALWNSDIYTINLDKESVDDITNNAVNNVGIADSEAADADYDYNEMNEAIYNVQHPKSKAVLPSHAHRKSAKPAYMSPRIKAQQDNYINDIQGSIAARYAIAQGIASNANVKADPSLSMSMDKDLLNLSAAGRDANYDANHKDAFEAYTNAIYAANHATEYNTFGPTTLGEANEYVKEHSSSTNASSASANSGKASSVASSSTNSNASSKASSSATNSSSANSQSANQSSTASQNSNNNSSVAPSSEQSSDNGNNNGTAFIPSFNVPTTPSTPAASTVTPAQNTASMNNSNNNPSVEPQTITTNNNNNESVNNSAEPTANKHHNVRNHRAKHESVYLFNTDFKGLSKRNRSVITIKDVEAYRRTRRGHYVGVRGIKRGTKLAVKRVIKFGKITKLQLTNGLIVTSNKHFVAIQKPTKRVNKRVAKRNHVSRYNRALRKSNYVLRHGRRHATRYTYRLAKNFTKATKAEKKAHRKFIRKHTYRNRKAYRKAQINVNNLVEALLK